MSTIEKLKRFAATHDLILEQEGECGFGRPCVGFIDKRGNYVDYNPTSYPNYDEVFGNDERLYAPGGVDSYHKSDCMAVLVSDDDYSAGLEQLEKWVDHLECQGEVCVEEYNTGAEGIQAMFSGVTGFAVRIK